MYKSKLQELCHKKGWSFPDYSSVKDGPDHNPQFTASVTINGRSFQTNGFCRTSKEAQNEAAMMAYDHFTSPPPSSPQIIFIPLQRVGDAASSLSGSSCVSNKMKDKASNELTNAPAVEGNKSPKNQEISKSPLIHGNGSVVKDEFEGMQHLYKNQLQSYSQKRNYSLPTYSCVREGIAHAPHFKAKVTINGQTFESPGFSHTQKEAEHAAAKAALMSLSIDGPEMLQEESAVYKNLLQELVQKEGFSLPVYETKISGASHIPTFSSTVEVEGEVFCGEAAKTKKQAEMNAAKLAYFDLKECRSSRMTKYLHPSIQELEATVRTSSSSNSIYSFDLQQNLKSMGMTISNTITASKDRGEESTDGSQEVDSEKAIPVSAKVSTDLIPSPRPSNMTMRKNEPSSSDMVYAHLRDPFPSVPSPDVGPLSPSKASEYSGKLDVEADVNVSTSKETSSLLCNRVRIYPRMPNMVFPKDITILPISDDKWVAVSLEFADLTV
ncbi:hypothetical protein NE237_030397 [Protea cynaroides]|uniref:DRBM domain-containing protein n=1 Tax=Protea cynaroides TaxID=273540 RepID=A0A9Q0GU50_9MAGN|nr:hypothetical protein NE237_030397 [Protea cynaroides]